MAQLTLGFADTDGVMRLEAAEPLLSLLRGIMPYWPISVTSRDMEPFLTVTGGGKGYRLSSPFMDKPVTYPDPVDAVCAIIVELAWAHLRAREELLCLHGAGVDIGGNLVVIPSTRRAGKSTLVACLARLGHRVLSDDFLPLRIAEDGRPMGIASGIRPRVRLPLPDAFSAEMTAFAARGAAIENRRYRYLDLPAGQLAARGAEMPVGAIVVLDRRETGPAALSEMNRAEALKVLVRQNFSRALNGGNILQLMHFLAMKAPAYMLSYADAEEAARLLSDDFAAARFPELAVPQSLRQRFTENRPDLETGRISEGYDPEARYVQAEGIRAVQVDDRHFLSDEAGFGIFELNETSGAVWTALKTPTCAAEITDLFEVAFPDVPRDRIAADIDRVLRHLAWGNLLRRAGPAMESEKGGETGRKMSADRNGPSG